MDPGFAKSGLGALETSSNYLSGVSEYSTKQFI
jgi:hypothetical protein